MKATPVSTAAPQAQQDVASAEQPTDGLVRIKDDKGREIAIAPELDVLEEMRVLKVLGGENSKYLYLCTQLARVKKIAGADVPLPNSDREFQALAARLGRPGVNAVTAYFIAAEMSAYSDEASAGEQSDAEREAVKK